MEDSKITVNMIAVGEDNRGIYYPESQRIIIYLNKHESFEDLLKTINHELIHHCINICGETMDDDQEEKCIFCMSWADYSLV
jgi:predicted Zn-dependent protease